MNYVARVTLSQEEVARQQFYGVYGWHKAAWGLFPKMPDARRDDLGFLFRVDENEDEFRLTVASKAKPQRSSWCQEDHWLFRQLESGYLEHCKYLFKIRINPTRTTRKNPDQSLREKKHGRHEAILKIPELKEWFLLKAKQNGFNVLDIPELEIAPPVFHHLSKKGREGTIVSVDFKGALEVVDRGLFKKAFEQGIGRARSFGFGLLILKPIQ